MITIITGTNRAESTSAKVTRKIATFYEELGEKTEIIDLTDLPESLFAPSAYAQKPDGFEQTQQQILDSSGLVIVTPEYNGSYPGALKLFIDMLPFPESFEARPVCFIGIAAGQWGALRPVEHLMQVFSYRNAHIFPKRVFIPSVFKFINDRGEFEDTELCQRLKKQAAGFISFIKCLKDIENAK